MEHPNARPGITGYEVIDAYELFFGTFVIVTFNDGVSHRCMVDGSHYDHTRTLKARCGESYNTGMKAAHVTCIRCVTYTQERNGP